jgi:hypothetical protein
MNARSSSAKLLVHRSPVRPIADQAIVTRESVASALDQDAADALAWIESGMPDDRVGYGPDAPKLTEAQRQQFEPGSYVRVPSGADRRRRVKPQT